MTARPRRMGIIEAILIALVLVVQTLGTAYATGLGSRPVPLDAFGNPLCITSGEHGDAGDTEKHGSLKDCCALACAGIAAAGAPPPDLREHAAPEARLIAFAHDAAFDELVPQAFGTPTNPRAPPLAM